MINRENYKDTQTYLNYISTAMQRDPKTIVRARACLRHLLEWADDTPFPRAKEIKPIFPVYLLSARNDGKPGQLAPATMKKTCEYSRLFFDFCTKEHPKRYRKINHNWIDSIRPPNSKSIHTEYVEHKYFTIDEMLKIASLEPRTLREIREIASACFLFLSGMRASAYCTMPLKAVDLEGMRVKQLPTLGVMTKNHKPAITSLLNIPELMKPVMAWYELIKTFPADCLWYSRISKDSDSIIPTLESSQGRRKILGRDLKILCTRAGIDYKHPHCLRHGHVVYGLKRVKDMEEYKAVSQNVMHSSMGITDSLYGALVGDDVHRVITEIGDHAQNTQGPTPAEDRLKRVLAEILKENPGIFGENSGNTPDDQDPPDLLPVPSKG